jgi:hypothetical protein
MLKKMKKYIRNNDTITGKLHDEQVMLDIEKGKYFSLNPVATRIWEILEEPLGIDELCNLLLEEYEVDTKQCKMETNEYLIQLVKLGLVREIL